MGRDLDAENALLRDAAAQYRDLVPTERQPGWAGRRIMTEYTIVGGPTVTAHLAVDKDGRVVGATIEGTSDPREAELAASQVARLRFDPEEPRYFTPTEVQRFLERPVKETWSEHHGPALIEE
jgi:hypothetical protein